MAGNLQSGVVPSSFAVFVRSLTGLPRYTKRTIVVATDLLVFGAGLWLLVSLRYGEPFVPPDARTLFLLLLAPALTTGTFGWFGVYRLVTRFIGYQGAWRMVMYALLAGLLWALVVFLSGQLGMPRAVVLAYGPLTALTAVATRQLAGFMLQRAGVIVPPLPFDGGRNVIVYSAGPVGAKLVDELLAGGWTVVAIVDPVPSMRGRYIHGIRIDLPHRLADIVSSAKVDQVFVAFQAYERAERSAALQILANLPVKVRIVPDATEIASGRVKLDALRSVQATDLLGRDRVAAIGELLSRAVQGKNVLVSGAGGSIGSELVRQAMRLSPRRLVLLDASEPALYEIESEVRSLGLGTAQVPHSPEIIAVLGSVRDRSLLDDVLSRHEIDVVYHAAAYKHVPLVEHNPLAALANNVLGTVTIARAAWAAGVERFVLISTDKAVRPTSVMGATKRMAELVLQALAAEMPRTIYTAVRFGNVLDSSGSVVRKFRQQIRAGGPVTVTDPNVTRFFMSIEEAAELVIQASAMARGGEVFLLDMGEAVRIDDLARLMIRRSGLEVRSPSNPFGDIEISYIGLRPGEKLYEELLIGNNPSKTEHPRIFRTSEPALPVARMQAEVDALSAAVAAFDASGALAILQRTVEEYTPDEMTLRTADVATAAATRSFVLH